jgi:two-component system, LytTR family, sensor kinase
MMAGTLNIPKFHTKDFTVLVASMLPMAMLVNYFLYCQNYFSSASQFLVTTLVSFTFFGGGFLTYGFVAILLRNRFPEERQLFKRLLICLAIFFLMSAVYISLLLLAYDYFHFYGYEYLDRDFFRAYFTLVTLNIFLTFLNEGIYRFEKFKVTLTENEQLKKEYMHSRLLGLKSQMNPHFLFNSLNTLSSLIHENADDAEEFLDQMSKVYRYLLRNNEEQLVSIATELNFIRSYYYLLKARHGDGLTLSINVADEVMDYMVPPLTLQMIAESVLNINSISRSHPLSITIQSSDGWLELKNNVQPKMNCVEDCAEVMENISNKYRLLCQQEVEIREDEKEWKIQLPLIPNHEMIVA